MFPSMRLRFNVYVHRSVGFVKRTYRCTFKDAFPVYYACMFTWTLGSCCYYQPEPFGHQYRYEPNFSYRLRYYLTASVGAPFLLFLDLGVAGLSARTSIDNLKKEKKEAV